MNSIEALDFFARHCAFRSLNSIAYVAGIDSGNLNGALAGRRPLSVFAAGKVAAAVGLGIVESGGDWTLCTVPQTIINLALDVRELAQLKEALAALHEGPVCVWRLAISREEVDLDDVFGIAIARVGSAYLIASITSSNQEGQVRGLDGGIRQSLPGVWLPQEPEQFTFSTSSPEWIRLRAGVVTERELDRIFLREAAAGIEDWAQLMIELHQMGTEPKTVSRFMRGIIRGAAEKNKE